VVSRRGNPRGYRSGFEVRTDRRQSRPLKPTRRESHERGGPIGVRRCRRPGLSEEIRAGLLDSRGQDVDVASSCRIRGVRQHGAWPLTRAAGLVGPTNTRRRRPRPRAGRDLRITRIFDIRGGSVLCRFTCGVASRRSSPVTMGPGPPADFLRTPADEGRQGRPTGRDARTAV
jgi:hypothetical protein